MKKILAILLIILFVASCKKEQKKVVKKEFIVLSGKIKNANSDSFLIKNMFMETLATIKLKNDSVFADTIDLSEGYYILSDGKEYKNVFFKPTYDLEINLDAKKFDESLTYSGTGANENNYLNKKSLKRESFGKLSYYGYYAKLDEDKYLHLKDSLSNEMLKLFKKHEANLDKDFAYIESKAIEYEKLENIAKYESMRRFVTGDKDFKVSENYPNPFLNINVNDDKLIHSQEYLYYLQAYLAKKTSEKNKENEKLDYFLTDLKVVDTMIKNPKIKEKVAYFSSKMGLNYTQELDSLYTLALNIVTDKSKAKKLTAIYDKLKKIAKGNPSPDFTLKDIEGKEYTLASFKGKPLYIDIWATWCMPCIKEIPDLKKIEKEFGDKIHFLSICKSDTKENWEKFVKKEKLEGFQLFAPDENIPFFKDYNVQGIPRFILIDKDGKIIDSNAKRPSNPKLREELEALF